MIKNVKVGDIVVLTNLKAMRSLSLPRYLLNKKIIVVNLSSITNRFSFNEVDKVIEGSYNPAWTGDLDCISKEDTTIYRLFKRTLTN